MIAGNFNGCACLAGVLAPWRRLARQ